jgi:hypothetical protein
MSSVCGKSSSRKTGGGCASPPLFWTTPGGRKSAPRKMSCLWRPGCFIISTSGMSRGSFSAWPMRFPDAKCFSTSARRRGFGIPALPFSKKSGMGEEPLLKWGLKNIRDSLSWDDRFRLVKTHDYFGRKDLPLSRKNRLVVHLADVVQVQYMVTWRSVHNAVWAVVSVCARRKTHVEARHRRLHPSKHALGRKSYEIYE